MSISARAFAAPPTTRSLKRACEIPGQCICLQPNILESAVTHISYIDGDVSHDYKIERRGPVKERSGRLLLAWTGTITLTYTRTLLFH